MKKSFTSILTALMILFTFVNVYAAESMPPVEKEVRRYSLRINGELIKYPDQEPVLIDYSGEEVLFIPLRATYEALGYEVMWDVEAQSAVATKDDVTIRFPKSESVQYVNDVLQTLDRPVRTDNGRTLVSAMSLTKAFGYILSWDDISGVLDVISPENFGEEFVYRQSTHRDANTFADEYAGFTQMAEKVFVIPGLNEYVVPQGISYRKDTNQFYLSGYFKEGALNSVICVIDAQTGNYVGEYPIYTEEKTPFYGHVGGIAVSEKNLYIANGQSVYRVSLDTIDTLGTKAPLYPEETIKLSFGGANSFIDYSGGYLWTGNFYDPGNPSYNIKAHENYGALIRAYKLSESTENGFSEEKKTSNTDEYDYIPHRVYTYDKIKIQGMTTYGNQMFLAASYGKWGEMYVYDAPEESQISGSIILDGDKKVPVYNLTLRKSILPIPRIEEIVTVGEDIYATFESGAIIYRSKSKDSTTDSVWKIPIWTLLGE